MIHRQNEMPVELMHNFRGGQGDPAFRHLFTSEEVNKIAHLMAVVTLQPGESVGVHAHHGNNEMFYIMSGKVMIHDDGEEHELVPGDAHICLDGHTHGARNHTDAPAVYVAVVIPS